MTKVGSGLPARGASRGSNGLLAVRSITVGFLRVLFMGLSTVSAAPLAILEHYHDDEPEAGGASLWVLYVTSLVLVLLGGAFAGLTIA
jgi:metal transporter CNNM